MVLNIIQYYIVLILLICALAGVHDPEPPILSASLMDGRHTQLHIVEVVTVPSLRLARQQPKRAGQLCWTDPP